MLPAHNPDMKGGPMCIVGLSESELVHQLWFVLTRVGLDEDVEGP